MSKNSKAAIITEEYFQKTVNYIEGQKSQNTLAFADQIAGINWRQSKKCPICKQDLIGTTLTSALSKKEFAISGMCQKCQDKIFHANEEEEDDDDDDDDDNSNQFVGHILQSEY